MEIASAFVSLLPSAKGFGSKLNSQIGGEVERSGRSAGGRFGKVFATSSIAPLRAIGVAAVGLFAVDKVKDFFASSVGEAREAQKVGALTAQVIKTTGKAANVSAAQVGNLAAAISEKTGIDDEAIQSGQNMLLTFTNVRNEVGKGNKVFNQATRLATDMSAALGTDAKSAALQLGKALNDPAKGVTKLARSGVSFTEQQTEQIKKMQESGNVLGAQKIILGEVSKEFGGAAAAQATAGDKMSVAWGNLKEQIGTAILPALDAFQNAITTNVIPALSRFVDAVGPALSRVGAFLAPFVGAIRSFVSDVQSAFGFLFDRGSLADRVDGFAEVFDHALGNTGKLTGPLRQVGTVILEIVAGFSRMIDTFKGGEALNTGIVGSFEQIGIVARQAADTFRNVVIPAITSLVTYVTTSLLPVFRQYAQIILANVIPILRSFAMFIYGTVYPALIRIATVVATNLKPVFDQLVATFQTSVLPTLQLVLARFRQWQPTIQRVIAVVLQITGRVLAFAAAVLGKVLPVVIKFAGWLLTKLVPAILNAIEVIARIIGVAIQVGTAFVKAIAGIVKFQVAIDRKIAQAIKAVVELPGKVVSGLGDLGSYLLASGKALVQGFIDGIVEKGREAADAARNVVKKVRDFFPFSPAKRGPFSGRGWVLYSGRSISEALAKGISDKAPKAVKATFNLVGRIKDQIDGLMDSFNQMAGSIADTFTNGLFDATTRVDFLGNLLEKRGEMQKLIASFRKLVSWGLSPAFLSNLFQSGNGALIIDLAAGSAAQAKQAGSLYGQVQGLAQTLGSGVATEVYGPQIVSSLDRLAAAVDKLPPRFAKEINGTAKRGKQKHR